MLLFSFLSSSYGFCFFFFFFAASRAASLRAYLI